MIRTLAHGEAPPDGVEPKRYRNRDGYVRLRWTVGPGEKVECLEHRWVMGNPPSDVHVHHINHVKDDNRPENLKVVTQSEHGVEHRVMDRVEARRLYEEGRTTTEVGRIMGRNPAAIYRALRDEGVRMRSGSEALTMPDSELPLEDIRYLHERGVRSRRIAKLYGVSAFAVDTRVRELGLTPHRGGRPTDAERERAEQAIRELVASHA